MLLPPKGSEGVPASSEKLPPLTYTSFSSSDTSFSPSEKQELPGVTDLLRIKADSCRKKAWADIKTNFAAFTLTIANGLRSAGSGLAAIACNLFFFCCYAKQDNAVVDDEFPHQAVSQKNEDLNLPTSQEIEDFLKLTSEETVSFLKVTDKSVLEFLKSMNYSKLTEIISKTTVEDRNLLLQKMSDIDKADFEYMQQHKYLDALHIKELNPSLQIRLPSNTTKLHRASGPEKKEIDDMLKKILKTSLIPDEGDLPEVYGLIKHQIPPKR